MLVQVSIYTVQGLVINEDPKAKRVLRDMILPGMVKNEKGDQRLLLNGRG